MRRAVVRDNRLGQGLKSLRLEERARPLAVEPQAAAQPPHAIAEAPLRQRSYPQFVKYMGSKSKIMDFVLTGINDVHNGGPVCDLFAGSASLAGAIGDQLPIVSNDIQNYSRVLSGSYLTAWRAPDSPSAASIVERAREIVAVNMEDAGKLHDYSKIVPLRRFQALEVTERKFFDHTIERPWHLFFKFYSGTWWSAKQALWIDAIRQVAEEHRSDPCYDVIIASLMFAMAYASQGTGHYAQYRVANTESSMRDISIYRRRAVAELFAKKYEAVLQELGTKPTDLRHQITSLDYQDCLAQFEGGTVYADPPYAFVHYSRFYHALETLVLYDYPDIQQIKGETVKGRYREGRHQSPFCIRTQVPEAFRAMFRGVSASSSNLVLSYSNTGMISLADLGAIAAEEFKGRSIEVLSTDYKHMTLGRQFDRDRVVEECLMLVK
jgi:adenine-specific DNA-methyltransferase